MGRARRRHFWARLGRDGATTGLRRLEQELREYGPAPAAIFATPAYFVHLSKEAKNGRMGVSIEVNYWNRDRFGYEVKFFTAGGTIDKVYFDAKSEYEVGSPQVVEILREAHVTVEHAIESVLSKDSLDMTDEDRQAVRRRIAEDPADGSCLRMAPTP